LNGVIPALLNSLFSFQRANFAILI
jgi:hypothetical protein